MLSQDLVSKIVHVCNRKIARKGDDVSVSFYAFFANKNDNPQLLMEAATWWIETNQLDHFEKATRVLSIIERQDRGRRASH